MKENFPIHYFLKSYVTGEIFYCKDAKKADKSCLTSDESKVTCFDCKNNILRRREAVKKEHHWHRPKYLSKERIIFIKKSLADMSLCENLN